MTEAQTRCGYVALLGAPNAGKSTLLNRLVGQKLAIISPKPQTTRAKLCGIVMHGAAQIIFIDTPGIFDAKKPLERAMVKEAWAGYGDADVVLALVDASKTDAAEKAESLIENLKKYKSSKPVWLVLNKTDLCTDKNALLPKIEKLQAAYEFQKTFLLSARTGDGVDGLLNEVDEAMPHGPYFYDPETVTDTPQNILAAELTREQLFMQLDQELPYAVTVETDSWESFDNGDAKIHQTIYVQRDGHKGIVIGAKGAQLKAIGAAARKAMKEAFGFDVHLFLHVKVKENWQEKLASTMGVKG